MKASQSSNKSHRKKIKVLKGFNALTINNWHKFKMI